MINSHELKIVRERERADTTGIGRTTWWRWERAGKVPRRVQLGNNSVGYFRHEIEAWLAERAAEREVV